MMPLSESHPQKEKSTAYENYTVRSVDYRQFPQGDRYHFVLTPKQQPGLDMALDIDLQGNIITQ